MFTGIVTDVGCVIEASERPAGRRFRIACGYDAGEIALGASIACAGPCLTVVATERAPRSWFDVEVSPETLARTTLGAWREGARVNLERALRLGDELGGHLVTGHIDGVAEILERRDLSDMARFRIRAPRSLAPYIAAKGSVALDGTSLTVNEVDGAAFGAMLIPHTLRVTTWGERRAGDAVNLEVDLMARYVARLREALPA